MGAERISRILLLLLQTIGVDGSSRLFQIARRQRWEIFYREAGRDENFVRAVLTFRFGPCPVFTRLRLLITSVFKLIGRGRPCSFRNRPQALQSTEPFSSLRHKGVVDVPQFWQIGCN